MTYQTESTITEEDPFYEEYDFWAGDYDEYADTAPIVYKQRINFDKYGCNNGDEEDTASDITDDLPRNVYCDLVTTLNSKCVLANLLEMWRYI